MTAKKPKVLFVTYGGGHVNVVLPVIQALQEADTVDVEVLGLTTASAVLTRHNIPHLRFKDLTGPEDAEALSAGRKLAAGLGGAMIDSDETVAYLGLCYADLVQREGEATAAKLYQEKGRMAFLPLGPLRRLFDRCSPDLLVSTNSPRAEQAAFLVARERGVRALCIVDLFGIDEYAWIGEANYATRIAVLTESVRQFYIRSGKSPAEVVVTGNPAFDRLERHLKGETRDAFRQLKGWTGKKVILWASSPEPTIHPTNGTLGDASLPRRVDQALIAAAVKHPEWRVVIRPHPSETLSPRNWPANVVISNKDEDLELLLSAVDCVIVLASTVGMQAALLGRPVIQLTESIITSAGPFAEMGLARAVNSIDGLEMAIAEVVEHGRHLPIKLDPPGHACGNVVALIESLLR